MLSIHSSIFSSSFLFPFIFSFHFLFSFSLSIALCPSLFFVKSFHSCTGALTYYADQNDLFDLDKDCKGEIALANILIVESTADPKYRSESVFDVQARVLQGGDSEGKRTFTFDARSADNAEKWMRELCKATEVRSEERRVGKECSS